MIELTNNENQLHEHILSEGIPAVKTVLPKSPNYFAFSIDDPDISKLTIQLSSIHGDPDLYVSTSVKRPDRWHHDMRSTNQGLYPDQIIFEKTKDYNLTKTFYVAVTSWQKSSYSLVFFTENDKGAIGIQKLKVGEKLRGVMKVNMYPSNLEKPILDQPSLIYHMGIPSQMFKAGKEVQVRLNSHSGDFIYIVSALKVADITKGFYLNMKDTWLGGEYRDVVISPRDFDKETSKLVASDKDHMIDFYIRVYPHVQGEKLVHDRAVYPKGIPFSFNVAFYDEDSTVKLKDGYPHRGVVSNQTFSYFHFDVPNYDHDFEINLSPISGGDPDLVISLDPSN